MASPGPRCVKKSESNKRTAGSFWEIMSGGQTPLGENRDVQNEFEQRRT